MTNRQAAIRIIKDLHKAGFEALLAGGCVRDKLLSRTAKDYDVATSARPNDVVKLFRRTREVGAQFGVVMVLMDDQQVEVATFRTESGYTDGRHPTEVAFSSAAEDASRRDFTVNGMFYSPLSGEVIDYVGGREDLERSLLRTIGAAEKRFSEDYLRMLRAVRFSTQLRFAIEEKTAEAIRKHAFEITKISGERIAMEIEAILTNPNRSKGAGILIESTLAEVIFGSFSGEEAALGIEVLGQLRKNVSFPLALAAFFAGPELDSVIEKCRILKLSNAHKKHLRFLLTNRGRLLDGRMGLADLKMLLATPYFWDLYELQQAIQEAQGLSSRALMTIRKRARQLKGQDLRPKPLLNGHELIALGAKAGPMVGLLAEEMYIAQLGEELRTAAEARRWVADWLGKRQDY